MLYDIVNTTFAEALCDALGKTGGRVKVGIINWLAMREDKRNVDTLAPLLKDADAEIAGSAAWALGRIASPQAVSAFSKCYQDARETMRGAAADGLLNAAGRLVGKGSLPEALGIYRQLQGANAPEHVRMGAFAGSIEAQPDKAAGMLIEAVRSDDWKIRGMAIDMIVALEGEGVTERFSAGLDKLDADTQVLMIGALVGRGERDALRPVITKAASSSNAQMRALAIKSLGDIGDAGSDRDADVRWTAFKALADLAGPQDQKALIKLLVNLKGDAGRAEAELAMLGIIRNMTGPMPEEARTAAQTLRNKSKNEAIKKEAAAVMRLVDKFEDYIMAWHGRSPVRT